MSKNKRNTVTQELFLAPDGVYVDDSTIFTNTIDKIRQHLAYWDDQAAHAVKEAGLDPDDTDYSVHVRTRPAQTDPYDDFQSIVTTVVLNRPENDQEMNYRLKKNKANRDKARRLAAKKAEKDEKGEAAEYARLHKKFGSKTKRKTASK